MTDPQPPGFVPKEHHWPKYFEGQNYVLDNVGVIWLLCPEYDGGIATTATSAGPFSVGITVLRNERGPLHILQLTPEMLDNLPTIQPDPRFNEPINGTLMEPFEPKET